MLMTLDRQQNPGRVRRDRPIALAANPGSAETCRTLIRGVLGANGLDDLVEDAVTIGSELATNAIRAMHEVEEAEKARGNQIVAVFHLGFTWWENALRIEVWDTAPGCPELREPDIEAEGGRGLNIVDFLTAGKWGWGQSGTGKYVWAYLSESAA